MWRTYAGRLSVRGYATSSTRPPVISIKGGTFYRSHPKTNTASRDESEVARHGTNSNPPLFKDLSFEIPSLPRTEKHWAIIGPSSAGKTTFLQVLRGKHICIPPAARSWPYLETDEIEKKDQRLRSSDYAVKLVGFDGEQGLGARGPQSAYLSARYESRRENTDFSVWDYLRGNTELNAVDEEQIDAEFLEKVIEELRLRELVDMPVSNLSNGQTRRARIARALLTKPEVLLLDEPFMGLDPRTLLTLSPMLHRLAKANAPRLVLTLRPQDKIPEWITDLVILKGNCEIALQGKKSDVLQALGASGNMLDPEPSTKHPNSGTHLSSLSSSQDNDPGDVSRSMEKTSAQGGYESQIFKGDRTRAAPLISRTVLGGSGEDGQEKSPPRTSEALVEMEGAIVRYGSKTVLGNWRQPVTGIDGKREEKDGLWWSVRRGERWGIFGPNGSGKTTLLSLICSDHPQTYSLPIRLFGRSRLPEPGKPGISIFDLQFRIGHSSPEIHNHIPRSMSLRKILESAWADTFRGVPKLNAAAKDKIDASLRWFEQDLLPRSAKSSGSPIPGNLSLLEYLDERTNYDKPPNEEIASVMVNLKSNPHNSYTGWADELIFAELPFSAQRVALFLRAIIKQPELIILDEAFSGMDDAVRDRCLLFLAHGETKRYSYMHSDTDGKASGQSRRIVRSELDYWKGMVEVPGLSDDQALLCISHLREEIPGSVREWICLPEANTGEPARFGKLDGPLGNDERRWSEIWGM